MPDKINQLVLWLNTFDNNLVSRLGGVPFVAKYQSEGYYEIKNNLGRIFIRPENSFGIGFNCGWTYFTTLLKNMQWDEQLKNTITLHKVSLFLTVLPSNQKGLYHPTITKIKNLWLKNKTPTLTWAHITPEEVLKYILPYLQKTKQDQRDGYNKNYPYETKIKEIQSQLQNVKQSPELAQLVSLLET